MRRWNRTVLVWDCFSGMKTNIPVTDWEGEGKHVHTLHGMYATSLPKGKGEICLAIQRCVISPTNQLATILERLSPKTYWQEFNGLPGQGSFFGGIKHPEYSSKFTLQFELGPKQEFCNTTINTAKDIFRNLGVEDQSRHGIAKFSVQQETLVYADGKWIPFATWLRMSHGLPLACDIDAIMRK